MADFTRHDEHSTLSQSRENKPEKRHGLDASGVVFRIRACCLEQSLRPRWCARESSAKPSLARVRVAPSNGTQSAMEAIAAYWLQPSNKRSTLASVLASPSIAQSSNDWINRYPAPALFPVGLFKRDVVVLGQSLFFFPCCATTCSSNQL